MSLSIMKNERKTSSPLPSEKTNIQNSLISDTANYFEDLILPEPGKNSALEHRHGKKNGCKKRWFTAHEKSVLQQLVLDNESVILSRRNDGVSVHLKKEVWLGIAEKFNSHPQTLTQRNSVELRRCWENMKFKAKKTLHRVQRHIEAARASSQGLGLPFTAGASPRTAAGSVIGLADVFSSNIGNSFDESPMCLTQAVDASSNADPVEDSDATVKRDEKVYSAAYTKVSIFNSSASGLSLSPFFCLPSINVPENANEQSRDTPVLPSSPKSESIFVAPLNLSCDTAFLPNTNALTTPISSSIPCSDNSLHYHNELNEALKNSPTNEISFEPHNFTQPTVEGEMVVDQEDDIGQLSSPQGNHPHLSESNSPTRVSDNRLSEEVSDTVIGAEKLGDVLPRVTAPPLLPAMSALFSALEGQTLSVMNRPPVFNSLCLPSFLSCTPASSDAPDVCLDLSKKSCADLSGDVEEREADVSPNIDDRRSASPKLSLDSGCTENKDAKYVLCEEAKDEPENKESAFHHNNICFSYSPNGLEIPSLSSCFGPLSGTNSYRLTDSTSSDVLANASVLRSLLSGTSRTLLRAAGQDAQRLRTDRNWTSSVPPRVTTGKPLNYESSINNSRHNAGESLVSHRILKTLHNISAIVPEKNFNDPFPFHQNSDKFCGQEAVNTEDASPESRLLSEHILAESIVFENTLLYQRLRLLQEQLQEVSGEHLQKMRLMQEEHRERLSLFHEELSMKRMMCQAMLEKALRSAK